MNTDIETRRKRYELLVKLLGLGLAGFLVAPFILIVIKGLIGLAVSALIGAAIIFFTPAVAVRFANWRLVALKASAAANPIETLENQYADRQAALLKIRDNIKQSYSVLQGLYSQIQEHNEKFPDKPSQYTDKYQKLKALIELRGKKYKQAQANLSAFSELIDEKRSDWKIAQTMAEASKLANVGEDFQSKLLKDTALNTVQDGLNLAFSELETSLLDEQGDAVASKPIVEVSAAPVAQLAERTGPPILDLGIDTDNVSDAEPVMVKPKQRTARRTV